MEEKIKGRLGWVRNVCACRKHGRCLQKCALQVFLKVVVLWVSSRKHSIEENMGNGYGDQGNFVMSPLQRSTGEFLSVLGPSSKAPTSTVYSLGVVLHRGDTNTTLHQRFGS